MICSEFKISEIMGGIYKEGIIGLKGAFSRDFIKDLRKDIDILTDEVLSTGNYIERGRNRFYTEIHPERLSGFRDIVSHPWFVAVSSSILGPNYRIIEVGFDVPGPGSEDQPWHRDFFVPPETKHGRFLNSLAFNITTVDVTEDMGPFEIAPGTQWDDISEDLIDSKGMFPDKSLYPRYESLAQRKLPRMGDISARTALTIHRGTANRSSVARPMLIIGVDGPTAKNSAWHDLQVTQEYYDTLPQVVKDHLGGRVVQKLEKIIQEHKIEGLSMASTQ